MRMKTFMLLFFAVYCENLIAQSYVDENTRNSSLTFFDCLRYAVENSLELKKAKEQLESAEWTYKAYRSTRLPQILFQTTPFKYNNAVVSRYDYINDLDVYRNQKTVYSYGTFLLNQTIPWTGGTLSLESDLNYIHNIGGTNNYSQYSGTPLKIGYSQELFFYNEFKWNERIENQKIEKAQKIFKYTLEDIVKQSAMLFFSLANVELLYSSALSEKLITDTLYKGGLEKNKIGAIKMQDLTVLEIDNLNAIDAFEKTQIDLEVARDELASFLNVPSDIRILQNSTPRLKRIYLTEQEAFFYANRNNVDILGERMQKTEAEKSLKQMKSKKYFEANLSVSIGFNQVAKNFLGVYHDMIRGDAASISLTIPLIDWGKRQALIKAAKINCESYETSVQMSEITIRDKIKKLLSSLLFYFNSSTRNERTYQLSKKAYELTLIRFKGGFEDANALSLARNRYHSSEQNYLLSQQNYWTNFYELRKLTLCDL